MTIRIRIPIQNTWENEIIVNINKIKKYITLCSKIYACDVASVS